MSARTPKRLVVADPDKCVGCQLCMAACSARYGDAGFAHTAIWVHAALDFEKGFIISVCRACEDPPCASVCPTKALIPRMGGGVIFRPALCIGCRNCVQACALDAIFWDPVRNKPITCIQCGICAQACPHEVLKLETVSPVGEVECSATTL
ncbi:MAG: 4Fe-4S binding protein [Candidatus Korarchaeota archaeon]